MAMIFDFNSMTMTSIQFRLYLGREYVPVVLKENSKVRSPMLCILCITELVDSMKNVLGIMCSNHSCSKQE